MAIFRDDLLAGVAVALSGASATLHDALVSLGASVVKKGALGDGTDERVDALVHDAGAAFGGGGSAALAAALEDTWHAVSSVAVASLIPGGRGGKVVLIAPDESAGWFAGAVRDGLENLARTLSVEWARYGITVTAIAPAGGAGPSDVALLCAYVLSPAGDYFSGCRFDVVAR
jgi:NAD(P)-dependent dehydrogenase (short-subunit alcohol dehydrogenase family)